MTNTEKFNDIYLNLDIRKANGKTDELGNYIFEVEASNENLDLQNQIVLQNALLESKEEFLRGGVISYDHLHKRKDKDGNVISDPSMIIGEPIDVKTNGKSTIVVGKLYAHNDKAKTLIKMLKDGSTRVRASVGGIFPEIIKNAKNGIEKITHVLWNDLALTTSPVNNTVGAAVFAKSMNSLEFVKALTAGYGTDSENMQGGRTLMEEDVGDKVVNTNSFNDDSMELEKSDEEKEAIRSLVAALKTGEVEGEIEATTFLVDLGITKEKARNIVREIINQGEEMMKKSFSSSVSKLLKSLTGQKSKDEIKKDDNDIELEDDDFDLDLEDDEELETKKSNCKKASPDYAEDEYSDEDENEDEEEVDGTEILKSLNFELSEMKELAKSQAQRIEDLGAAVVGIAEMLCKVGGEKMPPSATFSKSLSANDSRKNQNTVCKGAIPTLEDVDKATELLCRAVRENRLSIEKSSVISSDMQKSLRTGEPMKAEYYDFLVREFKQGGN